ncbi:unnamed protein product [Sphenostylis stenocarpa]|uniref:Uncharacterized protein n=1 Tax=Sphenostylis stenocarpa TaxID=92480 RepID=A0AA86VDS9_9FABA|nr:unnamed protein product [Sphenostylis stenocarpa]
MFAASTTRCLRILYNWIQDDDNFICRLIVNRGYLRRSRGNRLTAFNLEGSETENSGLLEVFSYVPLSVVRVSSGLVLSNK